MMPKEAMLNADKFKTVFGLHATEIWAMTEKEFLTWLNAEYATDTDADTISRKMAIDAFESVGYDFSESGLSEPELEELCEAIGEVRQDMIMRIRRLPSAGPERKKGKWIYGEKSGQDGWYCSECEGFIPWYYDFYGLDNIDFIEDFKTCPFCDSKMVSYTGADMRGKEDE